MRIEVVGSRGQLGQELLRTLAQTAHTASGHDVESVDIRDPESVGALLDRVQPEAVINCAAWTRVDAAEAEEQAAARVNALGPRILAEACEGRGILLCHVSTDYVFDGSASEPIDEAAVPPGTTTTSEPVGRSAEPPWPTPYSDSLTSHPTSSSS